MNYLWLLLFVPVILLQPLIACFRGQVLYKRFNSKINLVDFYKTDVIATVINIISPLKFTAVLIRPLLIKRVTKINYKISASVSTVEQLVEWSIQIITFFVCVLIIGFAKLNFTAIVIISLIAFLMLILLFFEKRTTILVDKSVELFKRVSPKKIVNFINKKIKKRHFIDLIEELQKKENKKSDFVKLIFWSIALIIYTPLSMYLIFRAFDINLSYTYVFAVFWLPFFLGRVSGIPGGFGVREGAMILILSGMGVNAIRATEVTIYFRILTIAVIAIAGAIFSLGYGINIFKIKKLEKE